MSRPDAPATADPSATLLLQFLAWVEARPRFYAETMAAWRTSCPRLQVWEDATAGDLVKLEAGSGATLAETPVTLTVAGRALLAALPSGRSGP